MASFVRIAAEDPSLIGLGRQSTIPIHRGNDLRGDEVASIEAQGLGGAITSVASADLTTTGLSTEWSVVNTPLMRQPERPSLLQSLAHTCTRWSWNVLHPFVMAFPSLSCH